MSVMLKDPDSDYDYVIEWADWLGTDIIASSTWAVQPAGELAVASDAFENASASAKVTGGVKGQVYRLANTIVTEGGNTAVRTITVRGGDR